MLSNYTINPWTITGNVETDSTLFVSRKYSTKVLTNAQKESFFISPEQHNVIIGSMLGDLFLNKQRENARLEFKQSSDKKEYIYHLFNLFSSHSNMVTPKHKEYIDKRNNKVYTSIGFATYSLPCFNYYYDLFYVDRIKTIPFNIGDLMTAESLAYWLMDDSYKHSSGLSICTESFTEQEVLLLISVLKEKFNLNCNPMKRPPNNFRIYVKAKSLNHLRNLVSPYFVPFMMYKINKESKDNNE